MYNMYVHMLLKKLYGMRSIHARDVVVKQKKMHANVAIIIRIT